MSIDVFNNRAQTTVSSGGTTAPASGTSESWTVASSASFVNGASSAASPPTQFRVVDVANPTEIMLVTNQSGPGSNTWTVTRGVEGTTPIAHISGWIAQGVITVAGLDNRYAYMGSALFESFVRANSLDQFAAAAADVSMGGFNIQNLLAGINPTDGANISQLPGLVTLANTTATTTTTSTTTLSTLTGAGTIAVATLPTNLNALNYCQVPTGGGGTAILSFTGASAGNLTGVTFISATSGTAVAAGAVTFGWVPPTTGTYLVRCIGGGGGGGGGGTPTSAALQVGAGAGAQGSAVEKLSTLTAGTFYAVAAGAGAPGGAGGAANGHAGSAGSSASATTFGTLVSAVGGGGGSPSLASTTTGANYTVPTTSGVNASGGMPGTVGTSFTSVMAPGCGGFVVPFFGAWVGGIGLPAGFGPGGGTAGGTATATVGGVGGAPGSYNGAATGNTSVTANGANGANGVDYGAGGGGGGGGASTTGAGGTGGNGAQGAAYIIGPLV